MYNQDLLYNAIQAAGITMPKSINPNGFSRWGKNSCFWALPVGDGFVFGDWSTGQKHIVFPDKANLLTRQEQEKVWATVRHEVEKERLAREKRAEITANLAMAIWSMSSHNVPPVHPYLTRKQISGDWIRYCAAENSLKISLSDTSGKIWNVQTIRADGTKRYLAGGRKKGCFFTIGYISDNPFIVCEGFATGQSIYDSMPSAAVFVAFDAGNIESVVHALRQKYTTKRIIIAADNDWEKAGKNTGLDSAVFVAKKFGLEYIAPGDTPGITDWNDVACRYGCVEVARQFVERGLI